MNKKYLVLMLAAALSSPFALAEAEDPSIDIANGAGDDAAAEGDVISANGPGADLNLSNNTKSIGAGDDYNNNSKSIGAGDDHSNNTLNVGAGDDYSNNTANIDDGDDGDYRDNTLNKSIGAGDDWNGNTSNDGNDDNLSNNTLGSGDDGDLRDNTLTVSNDGDDGNHRDNQLMLNVGAGDDGSNNTSNDGNDDNLSNNTLGDGDDGDNRDNTFSASTSVDNGDNRDNSMTTNDGDDGDYRDNSFSSSYTDASVSTTTLNIDKNLWMSSSKLTGTVTGNSLNLHNNAMGGVKQDDGTNGDGTDTDETCCGDATQSISYSATNSIMNYESTGIGQASIQSGANSLTQQSVAVNASIHNN